MSLLIVTLILSASPTNADLPKDPAAKIDQEAIREVIRNDLKDFRECFERELEKKPDLAGKVILNWDVTDTGKVKSAKVDSTTLKNARAEKCLVGAMSALTFPAAAKGKTVNVKYPFVFDGTK